MKCHRISDVLNLNYTRINKPKIITNSNHLVGDMEISKEELDNTLNKLEKV